MKDWSRWVSTFSALVFFLSNLSVFAPLPVLASPQKSGPSAPVGAAHSSLTPTSGSSPHLSSLPKLPSLAPALPVSVAKTGGLVFNGDPSLPAQFNLNLSSVTAAYKANISQPTQIYVGGAVRGNGIVRGGTAETITPGELLTPSQYVALGQVTATGHQSLVLTASGAASAGFLTLTPADVSGLTALYVPSGVSLNSIGFTQATPLLVSGATNVNGSLFSLQQARGLVAQLDFGSLTVGSSGLITSNLPRNISLFSSVVSAAGLTVNVTGALHNAGIISSQGALTLSAGGGIYNEAPQAVMSGSAVNLFSGSGTFTNAGLISAASGNINLASQMNTDINFNNAGGTVSALAGSVNVRDASYSGSGNVSINGGSLLANSLNLYSGQGNVDVNSGTVQGVVNVYAGSAHVVTATNDLQLGTMDVSGDPLFYNQQVGGIGGNVTIQSNLIFDGQDLAIVAGGNISVNPLSSPITIATNGTSLSQNGGNIYLVAGANISNCSPCNIVDPMPPNGPASTAITVSGASTSGGSVNLTNVSTISTNGFAGSGSNGGTVMMVAFAGVTAGSGMVNAGNSVITTGGSGSGNSGSVVVIAGAASGVAVTLGTITANGGTGTAPGTGNVSVYTAQPMSSDPNPVVFDNTGSIISGNTFVAGGPLLPASVALNNVVTAANTLTIQAGGTSGLPAIAPSNVNALLQGATINLLSNAGDIGASTPALSVQTSGTLTVNSAGSVYINQNGNFTLGASSAGTNFLLNAGTSTLVIGGSVSGGTASGNYVNLTGGSIFESTTKNAGTISGAIVSLTSSSGDIGTDPTNMDNPGIAVSVKASQTLFINASNNAYVTQNNSALTLGALNLLVTAALPSSAVLYLATTGQGDIDLGQNLSAGRVVISNTNGAINVGNYQVSATSSVNLTAMNGDIKTSLGGIISATFVMLSTNTGVNIASGSTVSGSSITITSPQVIVNGGIEATNGNLLMQPAGGDISVSGNGGLGIASGGTINFLGGGNSVFVNVGIMNGTVNASGFSVSIASSTGGITAGSLTTTGGDLSVVSLSGSVTLGENISTVGASGTGGNLLIVAEGGLNGQIIPVPGLSVTTGGGNVALVAGSTINGGGSPFLVNTTQATGLAGSVYLSSGYLGSNAIIVPSLIIGTGANAGSLLATTAFNPGTVTMQYTSQPWAGGPLAVPYGTIVSNALPTQIAVVPAAFSNSSPNATLSPAQIPGGGFTAFTNSGTLTLQNDPGSIFSFKYLVPIVVNSVVTMAGTTSSITDGSTQETGTAANFIMVAPAIITTGLASVQVGGSLKFFTQGVSVAASSAFSLTGNKVVIESPIYSNGGPITISTNSYSAGDIVLASTITGSASNSVSMYTYNGGNIIASGGVVQAGQVVLQTAYGNIGSQGQPLQVSADMLTVNTSGNGGAFIYATPDLTNHVSLVGGQDVGGALQLFSPSAVLVSAGISAASVSLTAGSIVVNYPVGATSGGVMLTANGAGGLTIYDPVSAANGNVTLTTNGVGGMTLNSMGSVSTMNGGIALSANGAGALDLNGTVTAVNGGITLLAGVGGISVGSTTVSDSGGNILLNANGPIITSTGLIETLTQGPSITVQNSSGDIATGMVTSKGGDVSIVSLAGNVNVNGNINTNGGNLLVVDNPPAFGVGSVVVATTQVTFSANVTTDGGSVAMVANSAISGGSFTIDTALPASATGGGNVYLSSGGTINVTNLVLGGGMLLATTDTNSSVAVTPTLWTPGTPLVVNAGVIVASNPSLTPVTVVPAAFSNSGTFNLSPAQIPGGGFTSFNNMGVLVLQNDSPSNLNTTMFSFGYLVPLVVSSGVGSLGTITDNYPGNTAANLTMVAPAIATGTAASSVQVGGNIKFFSNQINLTSPAATFSLSSSNGAVNTETAAIYGTGYSINFSGKTVVIGSVISDAGGSINFNSASPPGAINVSGSSLQAQTINFNGNNANVSVNLNAISGIVTATGSSISLSASTGSITAGVLTSNGGDISIVSLGGGVTLNGVVSTIGTASTGGNLLVIAQGGSSGLITLGANITTGGGNVAMVASSAINGGSINTIQGTSETGGNVYLSSGGTIGTVSALNLTLGNGMLLATTYTNSSTAVMPTAWTGLPLSMPGNAIYASNPSSTPIMVVPAAFNSTGTFTLSPAQIPGGGFSSFNNTGTIILQDDPNSGTGSAMFSFAYLVPLVVNSGVKALGTIMDTSPVGTAANFTMVAPTIATGAGTALVQVGGDIKFFTSQINVNSGANVFTLSSGNGSINTESAAIFASGSNINFNGNTVIIGGPVFDPGGMINFTGTTGGTMNVSGGISSTVQAGTVGFNNSSGAVSASLNSIAGTISGTVGTGLSLTTAVGGLSLGAITTTAGNVSITANGGGITLGNSVTSNDQAGMVTLTGSNIAGTGLVTAATVSLTATTGNIDASGTGAGTAINTATANLQLSAVNGSAYINNTTTGGLSLNGNNISVQQSLSVSNSSGMSTSTTELTAGAVSLSAYCITVASGADIKATSGDVSLTATGDDIKLDDAVTSVNGSVTLNAKTDVYLGADVSATAGIASLTGSDIEGSGLVSAATVSLTATTGSIDASGSGTAVNTATSNLQLSAVNGSAYVSNTSSGGLSLNGSKISVQQTLSVTNNNGISTSTNELAAGAVSLTAYCITVASGADIKATSGDVNLTATGDDIKLDAGVVSVSGNVTLNAATDIYVGVAVTANGTACLKGSDIEGTGLISGATVSLKATTGSIDASGNGTAVNTATSNLQLSAVNGSAYVSNTTSGGLSLNGSKIFVQQTLSVSSNNGISTSTAEVTAGTVSISGYCITVGSEADIKSTSGDVNLTATGDDIKLDAAVTSVSGSVILDAKTDVYLGAAVSATAGMASVTGSYIEGSGVVSGATVSLTSNAGDIGTDPTNSGTAVSVQASQTLTLSTTGNAYVSQDSSNATGPVSISIASAIPGTLNLAVSSNSGNQDITFAYPTLAANNIIINNQDGGIQVGSTVVTGTTSVTMMTMNGNITSTTGGSINGGDVQLHACEGTIGVSPSQRLDTSASTTLQLNGDDGVYVLQTGSVSLAASGTDGATFDLVMARGSNVTITGGIDTQGSIVNLTVSGNGSILQGAGNNNIAGSNVNLYAGTGTIGQDPSVQNNLVLQVAAGTLAVTSSGNVFIEQAASGGSLTLSTSSAGAKFELDTALNSGNDIMIDGGVTVASGGTIVLSADGSIDECSGTLSAATINLTATSGNIGENNPVLTAAAAAGSAGTLTANAVNGDVYISQSGSVNLGQSAAGSGNTFSLTTTNAGNIVVQGSVTAGEIDLTADTVGEIYGAGTLTAGTINLASGSGDIGDIANGAVNTATPTGGSLILTAVTNGGVLISQTGDLSLSTSSAGSGFDFVLNANGGNLTLVNDVSAGNKVSLTAGSIASDCTVSGTTVFLQSTTGDIGSDLNNIIAAVAVNASSTVTVVSFGNAYVEQTGTNDISLTNSSAGSSSVFEFTSDGGNINLVSTGTIPPPLSAGSVTLIASNGGINIGSVQVTASPSGSVVMMTMNADLTSGSTGLISGGTVNLHACESSIGSDPTNTGGQRVNTAAGNTLILTSDDNVFVSQIGSATLQGSSSGNSNTFDLLMTAGSNLNIDAGSTGVGGGSVTTLTVAGAGTMTFTTGAVSGNTVNINTGSGAVINEEGNSTAISGANVVFNSTNGGDFGSNPLATPTPGHRLTTDAGNLTVTTTGNVYVQQNNDDIVLNASSAGTTFDLITAAGSGANIFVYGNINVNTSTGTISLVADDSISRSGTGVLTGNSVKLTSTNGSIGSDPGSGGTAINTAAATLTANATNGDVYISQSGSVNLGASQANASNNTFSLTTTNAGSINVTGAVSGNTVNLTVDTSGNIYGAGTVTGTNINLVSGSGDIGDSTNGAVNTATPNGGSMTLSAMTGGNVLIMQTGNFNLTTSNAGTSPSSNFFLTSTGSLQLVDDVQAGGEVSLMASSIGSDCNITAATVYLKSTAGDIGSDPYNGGTAIALFAGQTVTIVSAGNAYVNQLGSNDVSLTNSSGGSNSIFEFTSAGGNINLVSTGTTPPPLSGGTVNIYANGGGISIGSVEISAGTVYLQSTNGDITNGATGLISANSISLTAQGGAIGTAPAGSLPGQRLYTASTGTNPTLTLNGDNGVYVSQAGSVTLGASGNSNSGNFDLLLTSGSVTIGSASLTGGISSNGGVNLTTSGNGAILQGVATAAGTVNGTDVTLKSTTGNIGNDPTGTAPNNLLLQVGVTGTLNVSTGGNVFIEQMNIGNPLTLGASSAGTTLEISTAAGSTEDINVSGVVNTGSGGSGTKIVLMADGNINQESGGNLISGTVNLTATTGSIGSDPSQQLGAAVATQAQGLTATASNGNVYIAQSGSVDLSASHAGNTFTFELDANVLGSGTTDSVQIDGGLTAKMIIVNVAQGTGGGITVSTGNVGTSSAPGTTSVKFSTDAGDIATVASSSIVATNVTLSTNTSGTGSIGTNPASHGAYVNTSATGTVTVNAGGNVFVSNGSANDVSLGASSAGNEFQFVGNGTVTVSGLVSVGTNVIIAAADNSGGSIVLGASVNGGSAPGDNIAILADGGGTITRTGGMLSADTVTLVSGSGDIGAATNHNTMINTAANNLQINSAANVFVYQSGDVNVTSTPLSSTVAAQTINLLTSSGSITITGPVRAGTINLTAGGSGSITEGGGILIGQDANLSANGGSIGGATLASDVVLTQLTGSLTATTGLNGSGNVVISNTGAFTIGQSNAGTTGGGQFAVAASGDITVSGTLQGENITLQSSTASNINIIVNGNLDGGNNSGDTILIQTGSSSGSITGSGTLTADTVTLQAGQNIGTPGTSTASPVYLQTAANNLQIIAGASAYVSNSNGVVLNTSSAGSNSVFNLLTLGTGTMQVAGNLTGGTILLTATGDISFYNTNPITIAASGGDIGITSSANIDLGAGNSFSSSGGFVWANSIGGGISSEAGTGLTSTFTTQAGGSFSGGGVALLTGSQSTNIDNQLLALLQNRANPYTINTSGATITGPQPTATSGGTVSLQQSGSGTITISSTSTSSTMQANGGVIYMNAPSSSINLTNLAITSTAPGLTPTPTPPGPSPTPVTIPPTPSPTLSQSQQTSQVENEPAVQTATKIATDTTPQSAQATALNGTGGNPTNVPNENSADLNGPIGGTSVSTGHFDSKTIANLRSAGVDIGEGSSDNFVILNRGNLLFQPTSDMSVRVQEGTVYIPNGATAFVIETGHDVAVYDMHDGHHGAVKVQVGKKLITLAPGKQVVLTRQLAADFDKVNPGPRIAYRGVHGEVVAEGIKAYAADFSIPSIMMNVAPLKRMLASDVPSERRQAHKLLKNAVILAQMTGQAGPFQSPSAAAPIEP